MSGCADVDGRNSGSTSDTAGPVGGGARCPACGCSLPAAARGSLRCCCELESASGGGSGRDRCCGSSTAASVCGSSSSSSSEDSCRDGSCSHSDASCCDGKVSARSSSSSTSSGSGGGDASSIDAHVVEAAHQTLARRAAKGSRPQQAAAEEAFRHSVASPAPQRAWGVAPLASACRRCVELQDQLQVAFLWNPCQP